VRECCHRAEDYKEYRKYHHTPQKQPMGACHPKGAAGIIHIVIPIGKLKRESNHAEKCPDTGDVERESRHLFQGN
jgi:hypothetical protein